MPLQAIQPTRKSPPRSTAQTRTHKFAIFPSPTKGLNASAPLVQQDPLTANILNNWWVRKHGPELRGGYNRWTTNLGSAGPTGNLATVKSVMAYQPPRGSAGTFLPALFACCDDSCIYDVTAQTDEATIPPVAQNLGAMTNPGVLSWVNFGIAGSNYLVVCGAGIGVWTYDQTGGWVDRTASITGIGAGIALDFDYVTVWKSRLWFIRARTGEAYYLEVNVIGGDAFLFDLSPLLPHGGELSAISSFTVDGGDGINDKIVFIGSEGDVIIYEGSDPSDIFTFSQAGRWYVGRVPDGRRFTTDHGGDLAIITERGIEYLSRLMTGRGLLDPESVRDTPAFRFNEIIGTEVKETRGETFWSIIPHPAEESVIITTPKHIVADSLQYIFAMLGTAWSTFTGMPMVCLENYGGTLYFGTTNGQIMEAFNADSDDVLTDGTVGATIQGDIQTAYVTDPSNPMALKRPLLIMPMFQSRQAPELIAQVNTEWAISGGAGSAAFAPLPDSQWGTGLWGTALWSGAEMAFCSWLGAAGLGVYCSLRASVRGLPGTIFTSWKLVYEPGGIM